mmetsp:Transcript_65434/g.108769  ORF Transcript_65434/g.108769 Transcript_65434/m.108769 type:complete len:128 (+) Transcript_65434:42-425(+)
MLLIIACLSVASRHRQPAAATARRALLHQASSFSFAYFSAALPAASQAAQVLKMDDELSAGPAEEAAPVAQPIALSLVPTGEKKSKPQTSYGRIKELSNKGQLTDKEKKELRRLKAEEMCEMLGKGC